MTVIKLYSGSERVASYEVMEPVDVSVNNITFVTKEDLRITTNLRYIIVKDGNVKT